MLTAFVCVMYALGALLLLGALLWTNRGAKP